MKKFVTTCFLLTYSVLSFGQLTIDHCQEKAKQNYPLIKQYELIERSKQYSLSNANKNFLPQLSLTGIGGIVSGFPSLGAPDTSSGSSSNLKLISIVQLNQTIWDGGTTKAAKAMTEAQSDIDVASLEVDLYALKDRVNQLFFGILLIDEQTLQLDLLQANFNRNKKRVEEALKHGIAYQSDLDEIQVEIINATQKQTELQYNRKAYVQVLAALIDEPIGVMIELIQPVVLERIDEIHRPELAMFNNQRLLLEAKTKMDHTSLYPKIGLMGLGTFISPGMSFGQSNLNHLLVGGLNLSWNIGGLYKNKTNQKINENTLEIINVQQETFLFNTHLQLSQKTAEMERFETLLSQDRELLRLKGNIKKSYETKYENGVSTMSDLLIRINDENLAQENLIAHEIQYLMAKYQYQNISGN